MMMMSLLAPPVSDDPDDGPDIMSSGELVYPVCL